MTARDLIDQQIDKPPNAARLNTVSPADEQLIAHTPRGHKHLLLCVALWKYAVQRLATTPAERLELLGFLDTAADPLVITGEVVAAVEPASDALVAIIHAARALDPHDDPAGLASFKMLTSGEVFSTILRVQPTLLAALLISPSAVGHRRSEKAADGAHTPPGAKPAQAPVQPTWVHATLSRRPRSAMQPP
jgi:hypothetical protein